MQVKILNEMQRIIEELENASEQLQIAAKTDIAVKESMNVVGLAAMKLSVIKERIQHK